MACAFMVVLILFRAFLSQTHTECSTTNTMHLPVQEALHCIPPNQVLLKTLPASSFMHCWFFINILVFFFPLSL